MNKTLRIVLKYGVTTGVLSVLVLFGLPLGNFLGGVFGLKIAGAVSGAPIESGTAARVLVLAGMISGLVLTVGSFFIMTMLVLKSMFRTEEGACGKNLIRF